MLLELGDVAWYLSMMANALGYKMSEVLNANAAKLDARAAANTISGDGDER